MPLSKRLLPLFCLLFLTAFSSVQAQPFRYFDPADAFRTHYPQLEQFHDLAEESSEKALEYLNFLADSGHAGAQMVLGELFLEGRMVPQDKEKAFQLLGKSAAGGHWLPLLRLNELLNVPENATYQKAPLNAYRKKLVTTFRRWADAGCLFSLTELGVLQLQQGETADAYRWLNTAADEGVSIAEYHLALMEMDGAGGKTNTAEALSLLELAASKGVIPAQQVLHRAFADKDNGLAFAYAAMIEQTWYRFQADFGMRDPEMDEMAAHYRALAEAIHPELTAEELMLAGLRLQRGEVTSKKYEEWMGRKMNQSSLEAARKLQILSR